MFYLAGRKIRSVELYLTEEVSVMTMIGSLTGNILPPFVVRLMFGVLTAPLALTV
jgi:hypothetical protein